mmetsp:Transcript_57587/g.115304  ORF Transcript_57587/g.115304 Transcript_57587/m.115304 type:complete len:326 (+) Transcript_57587:136-1113(+)
MPALSMQSPHCPSVTTPVAARSCAVRQGKGQATWRKSEYVLSRASSSSTVATPHGCSAEAGEKATCTLHDGLNPCSPQGLAEDSRDAVLAVPSSLSAELASGASPAASPSFRAAARRSSASCRCEESVPSSRNRAQKDFSLLAAARQRSKSEGDRRSGNACNAERKPSRRRASPRRKALAVALREATPATFFASSGTFLHDSLVTPQPGQRTESTSMASTPKKRRNKVTTWKGSEMEGIVMPCCCRAASIRHEACRTHPHPESWTMQSSSSRLSHRGQLHATHAEGLSPGVFCAFASTDLPSRSACLDPPSSLLVVSVRTSSFTQ